MGQAKNRGTYEERVKQAQAKLKEKAEAFGYEPGLLNIKPAANDTDPGVTVTHTLTHSNIMNQQQLTIQAVNCYSNQQDGFEADFSSGSGSVRIKVQQLPNGKWKWIDLNPEDFDGKPEKSMYDIQASMEYDIDYLCYDFEYQLAAFHLKYGIKSDILREALRVNYPKYFYNKQDIVNWNKYFESNYKGKSLDTIADYKEAAEHLAEQLNATLEPYGKKSYIVKSNKLMPQWGMNLSLGGYKSIYNVGKRTKRKWYLETHNGNDVIFCKEEA